MVEDGCLIGGAHRRRDLWKAISTMRAESGGPERVLSGIALLLRCRAHFLTWRLLFVRFRGRRSTLDMVVVFGVLCFRGRLSALWLLDMWFVFVYRIGGSLERKLRFGILPFSNSVVSYLAGLRNVILAMCRFRGRGNNLWTLKYRFRGTFITTIIPAFVFFTHSQIAVWLDSTNIILHI